MESTEGRRGGPGQRAWIHFFKHEAEKVRQEGIKKVCRATVVEKWKKLTNEEKCRFGTMHEDPSSNVGERSIEKQDEEQKIGDKHSQCNLSRCRVSALTKVISTLSADQQAAIREIGFGSMLELRCGRLRQDFCETLVQQCDTKRHCIVLHGREFCLNPTTFSIVMGIKDGGEPVYIREEAGDIIELRAKYRTSERGIEIAAVSERIIASESSDDDFKIMFCLFLLGTVLCPTSASYINPMYLHSLKDVQLIRKKNWATWCFNFLWEGIAKYKDNQVKSVSGCVVFLELFYFSAVLYDRCSMDRTVCPVSVWTKEEIRRLLNWRKKFGDMTSTEVPMRESNFLQLERNFAHFEQTEDVGPSTVNMEEAFRVLTQCVHRIEHKMDSFNVRMEMVEKSLEELRSKSPVGAPSKQPSDPCPQSPSLKIVEPTCPVRKTEPTTDGKNKMVMDSDEDSVDRRLNLSLDKLMGWMGTREGISEFRKDPTHFVPIPPPNLRDEDIDEPVQLKQEPQTSTSVSVLPTRPSRNRRPGRYQLSPYDQVSRGANPKYKAGPFQVNDPVTLEELKLIQYAFNKDAEGSEIIVSSYGEILNRHSLLTLLPGAYLCGEVISMKAHHLTLIQQVVEKDVPMNWYLPTRYSQAVLMVGDEVDCFARAARCGKNFMQQVHRCQKIYVPINDESSHWYLLIVNVRNTSAEIWDPLPDPRSNRRRHDQAMRILHSLDWILQPQLPSNMQHVKFQDFPINRGIGVPKQRNGYDCGVYVINYMDSPEFIPKKSSTLFTSEDTRGRLAIQLINSALNQNRDKLLELSNAQFAIHAVMVNPVSSQVQKSFHQQSGNIRKKKKVNTRTRA